MEYENKETEEIEKILDKRFTKGQTGDTNKFMLIIGAIVIGAVFLLIAGALLADGTIGNTLNLLSSYDQNNENLESYVATIESESITNDAISFENVDLPETGDVEIINNPIVEREEYVLVHRSGNSGGASHHSSNSGTNNEINDENTINDEDTTNDTEDDEENDDDDVIIPTDVEILSVKLVDDNNGYVNTREVTVKYIVTNAKSIAATGGQDSIGQVQLLNCYYQSCIGEITVKFNSDGEKVITVEAINRQQERDTKSLNVIIDTIKPDRVENVRAEQLAKIDETVKVTWGQHQEDVTYEIYRLSINELARNIPGDDNPSNANLIKIGETKETQYIEKVNPGTYSYYIVAVDNAGNPSILSRPAIVIVEKTEQPNYAEQRYTEPSKEY